MGFSQETFLFLFFPLSIVLMLAVSRLGNVKAENAVLTGLSLVFYAWVGWDTLLLFIVLCLLVYLMGGLAHAARGTEAGRSSRTWLRAAIALLTAVLVYFKYASAAADLVRDVTGLSLSMRTLALPLGLSFFIFEAISYLVDIARGEAPPGTLLETFTFLSLFPKLTSGPIILWRDFAPQLSRRKITLSGVGAGLERLTIGLAKKTILADTFGAQIALIEKGMAGAGVDTPTMWLRCLLYFFELYYDFSGYSDIAIGLCTAFGFSVKENFRFPYLSKSVTEFWQRWHISLGSWFREYVYIPLGGNRRGNVYLNLLVVFLLTGLWHGSGWTFLLWGAVHGLCVAAERAIRNKSRYRRIPDLIKWLGTMAVVFLAWVLFMSPSLRAAGKTYAALFAPMTNRALNYTWRFYLTKKIALLLGIAGAGAVMGAVRLPSGAARLLSSDAGLVIRRTVCLALFALDILFVVNSSYSPFMYFQF